MHDGILYEKLRIDMAASRGIYDGETVIKNLLVGAQITQTVSAIYKDGPDIIQKMNEKLATWMEAHKYNQITDFRGKASHHNVKKPALYERTQFMKYFADSN